MFIASPHDISLLQNCVLGSRAPIFQPSDQYATLVIYTFDGRHQSARLKSEAGLTILELQAVSTSLRKGSKTEKQNYYKKSVPLMFFKVEMRDKRQGLKRVLNN
jgi:hypothetical protein